MSITTCFLGGIRKILMLFDEEKKKKKKATHYQEACSDQNLYAHMDDHFFSK